MKKLLALGLAAVGFICIANASNDTATFEKMKALAGTWKGKAKMGAGGASDATVTYRVTSNGNTVQETIDPGTSHEMVTMYYLEGKSLVLTHYCAMGNQPHMKMQAGADANTASFDFAGGSNISPGDGHMHAMRLKFLAADKIQTQWMFMANGKPAMHATFDLHRVGKS